MDPKESGSAGISPQPNGGLRPFRGEAWSLEPRPAERFKSPALTAHDHAARAIAGEAVGSPDGVLASRASGGQPPANRLDLKAINGSGQMQQDALLILPCKCRAWCCGKCGPGYWASVGARVYPHLSIFEKPRLLTLTIDRKQFESGEVAFERIKGDGLIRRLMRLIGFRKGFSVLSFHPKAPEWPHWHILVDIADPGNWVDLKRMWRLWRDHWKCGGLDLNVRDDFGSAFQAAKYALGYCQHQAGTKPEWILQRTRLPRAWEVYGELRAVMSAELSDTTPEDGQEPEEASPSKQREVAEVDEPIVGQRRRRLDRTVADRLAECGNEANVLLRRSTAGGYASMQYMGALPVSPGRLSFGQALGELRLCEVETTLRELVNGTRVLDVWVPLSDREKPEEAFERLKRQADALMLKDHDERVEREVCDVPF